MKRKTIKSEVLRMLHDNNDEGTSFSELKRRYVDVSHELGHGCSPFYVSMNLTRILKRYGFKNGPAGSRALWHVIDLEDPAPVCLPPWSFGDVVWELQHWPTPECIDLEVG